MLYNELFFHSINRLCVILFQAFGVVIKLSDGILGLTLLAWGNSVGGQCLLVGDYSTHYFPAHQILSHKACVNKLQPA